MHGVLPEMKVATIIKALGARGLEPG